MGPYGVNPTKLSKQIYIQSSDDISEGARNKKKSNLKLISTPKKTKKTLPSARRQQPLKTFNIQQKECALT